MPTTGVFNVSKPETRTNFIASPLQKEDKLCREMLTNRQGEQAQNVFFSMTENNIDPSSFQGGMLSQQQRPLLCM